MSKVTSEFAAAIADIWHRFTSPRDMDSLAEMLRPMDDAGEALADRVGFDMEPSDFDRGLDDMSEADR